ncbi:MAG: glutamyl-tRNA amidotransferase [Gammaproteobacteria bacterium]|nr:MAG: glutamyl-tRNA amidotransferase [Gammaproteobacteria bacterium]
MPELSLKEQLSQAMKDAMRAKDKGRLGVIRMALAAFKQIEVDERIEVDATRSLAILDKMLKQRKDSATQYADASRQDLADVELFEISVIQDFLPKALTEQEISALIDQAVADSQAASMKDMGKVMGLLKPQLQGRADMGQVSGLIKSKLSS